MKALIFDGTLRLSERDIPVAGEDEALIRVRLAGICNTDLEIVKGYMNFAGILGHEFVGRIEVCSDKSWVGQRVVGEINIGCGECESCQSGMEKHCPSRKVPGIQEKDGCFAECITLPTKNLVRVPETVSDEAAVFVEPLAAACEILEEVHVEPMHSVAVVGDGKLGQLIARVLLLTGCRLTVFGLHAQKLDLLRSLGIDIRDSESDFEGTYDVVVDATGSPRGYDTALGLVKPRGILVLKSTTHESIRFNSARIVVDEIRVVGSRCGRFESAIRLLVNGLVDVESLITKIVSLDDAVEALGEAALPENLKILLRVD